MNVVLEYVDEGTPYRGRTLEITPMMATVPDLPTAAEHTVQSTRQRCREADHATPQQRLRSPSGIRWRQFVDRGSVVCGDAQSCERQHELRRWRRHSRFEEEMDVITLDREVDHAKVPESLRLGEDRAQKQVADSLAAERRKTPQCPHGHVNGMAPQMRRARSMRHRSSLARRASARRSATPPSVRLCLRRGVDREVQRKLIELGHDALLSCSHRATLRAAANRPQE